MTGSKRAFRRAGLLSLLAAASLLAQSGPFDGKSFHGRIAWSADGNHNDEDDWAASPVALAIFAAFGVQDQLVHFDYNSILNNNDPAWAKTHEQSVLGAVERFGYDRPRFFDCQTQLEAAIAGLAAAIDVSSADDPLYLVIAGPMEVAYRAIQRSDPAKRKHVYAISHSNWNDGYSPRYAYNFTKRDVIPSGVKWVQIRDQNRFLSTSPFGRPAEPSEWRPFHWLRDATDEKLRLLWERLRVSTRADCSDAGMAYFLMTGDEESEIEKVRGLLEARRIPAPLDPRPVVRVEAENFLDLEGFEVDFNRAYRDVSHRMNVQLTAARGRLRTPVEQPYMARRARYDVQVRYFDGRGGASGLSLFVNGRRVGEAWRAGDDDDAWKSRAFEDVVIAYGDELAIEIERDGEERGRVDYVELTYRGME